MSISTRPEDHQLIFVEAAIIFLHFCAYTVLRFLSARSQTLRQRIHLKAHSKFKSFSYHPLITPSVWWNNFNFGYRIRESDFNICRMRLITNVDHTQCESNGIRNSLSSRKVHLLIAYYKHKYHYGEWIRRHGENMHIREAFPLRLAKSRGSWYRFFLEKLIFIRN